MANKVGKFFIGLGQFFRILDDENKLSLTNIAVYVAMVKVALTQNVQLMDAGLILISLLNYAGKKVICKMPDKPQKIEVTPDFEQRFQRIEQYCMDSDKKIESISNKVSGVSAAIGMTRKKIGG